MIKCVIIDDEQHAIDVLQMHISKMPLLELQLATTNPIEAFQYVQQHKVDLIFLDIQMPELNGLQFLKLLNGKTQVILTTAYSEHALEGYEFDVVDYLLKPVLFDRFLKAVQKVIRQKPAEETEAKKEADPPEKEFLFVKTGVRNKVVKIMLSDILYVESKGNYVLFMTESEQIMTLLSLKDLENELPKSRFIRIHNSYIVSIHYITALEGNQVQVRKTMLPIGETYKKPVSALIGSQILNKK